MSSQAADKSFVTTFVALLSALALLAATLFMVAALVGVIGSVAPDDGSRQGVAVLERIKPVAHVAIAVPKPAGAEVKLSGQQVYDKVCAACHATGVTGAPKVGTKAEWEPRLAQGLDILVNHATNGLRAMPARGGDSSLTEANLKDAIVYMLDQTGLKTEGGPAASATSEPATVPEAPAPAAATPEPAPAAAPAATPEPAPAASPEAPAAPTPAIPAPAAPATPAPTAASVPPPAPLTAVPATVTAPAKVTGPIPPAPIETAPTPAPTPAKPVVPAPAAEDAPATTGQSTSETFESYSEKVGQEKTQAGPE